MQLLSGGRVLTQLLSGDVPDAAVCECCTRVQACTREHTLWLLCVELH